MLLITECDILFSTGLCYIAQWCMGGGAAQGWPRRNLNGCSDNIGRIWPATRKPEISRHHFETLSTDADNSADQTAMVASGMDLA
jgi:hypothetical protein